MPGMAPDSVVALVFGPDSRGTPGRYVALVTKARPEFQKGLLNGPGGKVEAGELPMDAVARETDEETGIRVPEAAWKRVARVYGSDGYTFWVYRTMLPTMSSLVYPGDEPVFWYPVDALPENVLPSIRWLIPLALDDRVREDVAVHVIREEKK